MMSVRLLEMERILKTQGASICSFIIAISSFGLGKSFGSLPENLYDSNWREGNEIKILR